MTQNTKDWLQYSTAIALILSSIVLVFVNFFVSHLIHTSVLMYIAECLAYAAGIFGTSIYFHSKIVEFETNIDKKLKDMQKPKRQRAKATTQEQ